MSMLICLYNTLKKAFAIYTQRQGPLKEGQVRFRTFYHFSHCLVKLLYIFIGSWAIHGLWTLFHFFNIIFLTFLIVAMHAEFIHCNRLHKNMFKIYV